MTIVKRWRPFEFGLVGFDFSFEAAVVGRMLGMVYVSMQRFLRWIDIAFSLGSSLVFVIFS